MLEGCYFYIANAAFRSLETPELGLPLQPEFDLLFCLDCDRPGLHRFSSEKPGAASAPGAGAAL